jgi:SAM-dependent methyltransferase
VGVVVVPASDIDAKGSVFVVQPRPADAARIYDGFARQFEAHAATAFWNAHYDRPAVLSLLPDVDGRRVLDAGCGPGLYAEELLARGARVVAFDASAEMVGLARARLGDRADVHLHDLNAPLDFVDDASVDAVVCALVWHYVDDRVGALTEFHRVLTPAGCVVLSCDHPTNAWLRLGGSYFDVGEKVEHWKSLDVTFPSWRLPLTVLCREFADAGFVIDRLVEPQPDASTRQFDPEAFDELSTVPGFVVFRLRAA